MRRAIPVLMLLSACLAKPASAVEGGRGEYPLGFNSIGAGVLPEPGLSFRDDLIISHQTRDQLTPNFQRLEREVSATAIIDLINFAYVTSWRILGAKVAFSMFLPVGWAHASVEQFIPEPTASVRGDVVGFGDLVVSPVLLGWKLSRLQVTAYGVVFFPLGRWSANGIANIGFNHLAMDAGGAFTYRSEKSYEVSGAAGFTLNFKNPATQYTSGVESHYELALAKHFASFALGGAGYFYQQVTGDRGAGALLGAFRGRVFGVGPVGLYRFEVGSHKASIVARYYRELGAVNHLAGDVVYLTALVAN